MKKLIAFMLTLCFLLSTIGQAWALYNPPSRATPTQEDFAVAAAFFDGIKFDISNVQNNIIKITIPKVDSKYAFSMVQKTIKEIGEFVSSYTIRFVDGEVKTVDISPNYITQFSLVFINDSTSALLLNELWEYKPGDAQVKYVPFEDRLFLKFDDEGNVVGYFDGNNNPVNEDGTPIGFETQDFVFKDVSENHWAYTVINKLAVAGYIKGYPDKTFKPEGNITKAEYMVMLANVLKDKWPNGSKHDHSSEASILPVQHWSNETVKLAFKYMPSNSIEQIFQNNFQPDKKITREEVVAVLMSVLSSHPGFSNTSGASQTFSDQLLSSFPQAINFASSRGLVSGYPDGSFKPDGNITRAEIAAVMVKVLEKL